MGWTVVQTVQSEHQRGVTAMIEFLGQFGIIIALGLGAMGSALGIGAAGMAAAGAWSKEARDNKPLNFNYIILLGMPISQTLYAMILMRKMMKGNNHAKKY